MTNASDGAEYLSAMTYHCLYRSSFERLKKAYEGSPETIDALHEIEISLRDAEHHLPSILFDLSKILLSDSKLDIDLQQSFLRMQANVPNNDMELQHLSKFPEFKELSDRAIALRLVLARIPDTISDRRAFLEMIKEIASSIKQLLDATNRVIEMLPGQCQQLIEKRKREFVHTSKLFSVTLKDFFKSQNYSQVYAVANKLVFQTLQIFRALREKVRLQ